MNNYINSEIFLFNTKVSQKIYNEDIDSSSLLDESINIMKNLNNILNFYDKNSHISNINKNAGKDFVPVSKEVFEIIDKAKYFCQLTDNLFDITIAPLVKMWGINSSHPKVPSQEELYNILPLINSNDIILDKKNSKVLLSKENQSIDLGGIAKGYIADYIIDFYENNNVKSALVNIGGNIKVLGKKANLEPWKVGIYEPAKHSPNIICSINIEDMSVVTSGTYERAFIKNNKLYHHILNPKTGYPAETDLKSITIVNESSLLCDALATPLLIMGKYRAAEFMKKYNINGIMVSDNKEIILRKNLLESFSLNSNYKVFTF